MTDVEQLLRQVLRLPIRGRAAFATVICNECIEALSPDPRGQDIARRALGECWRWIEGARVSGDALAQYVDGPAESELGSRQLQWGSGAVRNALIAITTAVAYTAHHAYEADKNRSRPAPIWEVSEQTLREVVVRAIQSNVRIEYALPAIVDRLAAACAGSNETELGPILSRINFLSAVPSRSRIQT